MTGDNWAGCGSGFDKYCDELKSHYGSSVSHLDLGFFPHAREMAQLAAQGFKQGLGVDPVEIAPIYLRNKIALKESER
tara:strand:- start:1007 stop:1240 length:234 start_codon:yes stop_codon:yes gene_type:complete